MTFRSEMQFEAPKQSAVQLIVEVVADELRIEAVDLFVKGTRARRYVWPRQIAVYCARMLTHATGFGLGHYFTLDHSTVFYAERTVPVKMRKCESKREQVERIMKRLVRELPLAVDAQEMVADHVLRKAA